MFLYFEDTGAAGTCTGVDKVLTVAQFGTDNQVTITADKTSLKADFTVTSRGTTIIS